jgi:hypothetical protein
LGLPAARLEELQQGLVKLQAEGVAEGIRAAKDQQAQSDSQRKTDTKAALAALGGALSANGLAAVDFNGYVAYDLVYSARRDAKMGRGLPAARLEELQQGLAKLQGEGVAEGLKAAKAAKVQRSAAERRQAAKLPPTKRRRASTNSDSELVGSGGGGSGGSSGVGGGGGGGGGSGNGGGGGSGNGWAVGLDSRFQVGSDDQAAEI